MEPTVGLTHDVVIWVNNSQRLGLTLAPSTYRVSNAPTFIPMFSVGDPSGIDRSRWKSWIQHRFDGGAGQIYYTGTKGNNRYAESSLIDLGMPIGVVGGLSGRTGSRGISGIEPTTEPEGLFSAAISPRATTSVGPMAVLFTRTYPVYIMEISNRPTLWHYKSMAIFTGAEARFAAGADQPWADPLVGAGSWAVQNTQVPTPIISATRFSGVAVLAQGDNGIRVWGSADGVAAASLYTPLYNTVADRVEVYDQKIWKTRSGRASYLTLSAVPATNLAAVWSDYKDIGDPQVGVNNTCVYGGKLYFGKRDALWVFDAGRYYAVEDSFRFMADDSNFKLMCVHKGSMYFNIRQRVYRYSVSGFFELLMMPDFDGVVVGGSSVGDELHIVVRTSTGEGEIWIFNSDTGGTRRWFTSTDLSWGNEPNQPQGFAGCAVAYGWEWIMPVQMSAHYAAGSPYASAVVAANRISPAKGQIVPYFAKTHSYLIMSMVDFGYPDLNKILNAVNIDYGLYSDADRIDISYLTELKGPVLGGAWYYAASTWTDVRHELSDGSVLENEGYAGGSPTQFDQYFGFQDPIEALRAVMGTSHVGIGGGTWSYWNGSVWNDISGAATFYVDTEVGATERLLDEAGNILVGTSEGVRTNDGTLGLTQTGWMYPGLLGDWAACKVNTDAAPWYYLRYTSGTTGATAVRITEVVGVKSLKKQNWISLGSIGAGTPDLNSVKKRISFALGTLVREVMLKFELWGTNATRPDVKRVEFEYVEEPSDLKIVDFTVLAVNDIETLDMGPNTPREMSGQYIAATLFSMSQSGRLYYVALPWPSVGETIRARVKVTDPGALVPILAYSDSWMGSPIPVRLDEM